MVYLDRQSRNRNSSGDLTWQPRLLRQTHRQLAPSVDHPQLPARRDAPGCIKFHFKRADDVRLDADGDKSRRGASGRCVRAINWAARHSATAAISDCCSRDGRRIVDLTGAAFGEPGRPYVRIARPIGRSEIQNSRNHAGMGVFDGCDRPAKHSPV